MTIEPTEPAELVYALVLSTGADNRLTVDDAYIHADVRLAHAINWYDRHALSFDLGTACAPTRKGPN